MDFVPSHKLAAISKEAGRLAYHLSEGVPVSFSYEPGNFTTYRMILCLDSFVVNKPKEGLNGSGSGLIVILLDFNSSVVCDLNTTAAPTYLAQKLRITDADASAISYLINEIRHYLRS